MGSLTARAHLWDSFHLHIEAWNSQLTSLEQKIEIMRRWNILSTEIWRLIPPSFKPETFKTVSLDQTDKVLNWNPNQGNYQSFQMFPDFERKKKIDIQFEIFLSIAQFSLISEENIPTVGSKLLSHQNNK